MPHVSKKDIDERITQKLDQHFTHLLRNSGSRTRVDIFNELLTETERTMLAKRLGMLLLIRKGYSSYKISQVLGVSPSTAERFSLLEEIGKYKHTSNWMWKQSREGSLEALFESLVNLTFTGRTRSFKKSVDEY
ncbi:MAG: helix-turn-helix domain-containing protein [Candidatus Pacebacteria bacterium]|nr:helix-turn-helix domain-containing protein [Candidatus Paceibacterota bacterium]